MLLQRPYMLPQSLHSKAQAIADGLLFNLNPRIAQGVICISGGGESAATETLTFTQQPVDGQEVVVGLETYVFQDALVDVANNVLKGADAEGSLDNLVAAIMLSGVAGTDYGTLTPRNTLIDAVDGAALTVDVTARQIGIVGNTYPCTTNVTGGSWGGTVLSGGTGLAGEILTLTGLPLTGEWVRVGFSIYTFLAAAAGPYTVKIGDTPSSSIDNLVAAITGGPGEGTLFGTGTQQNVYADATTGIGDIMIATAKELGTGGNTLVSTENLTNGSWGAGTFSGGVAFVGTIDPKVSCGDGHFEIPSCAAVDAGGAVSTFTTVGMWFIELKGLTQLSCPITAYTSGKITVQLVQAGAFKG